MTSKTLILSSAALFASMFTATGFALDIAESATEAAAEATAAVADTASDAADKVADAVTGGDDTAAGSDAFAALDADKDGAISAIEAEANPDLMKTWSSIDANQDGQLDASEFSAFETETGSDKAE